MTSSFAISSSHPETKFLDKQTDPQPKNNAGIATLWQRLARTTMPCLLLTLVTTAPAFANRSSQTKINKQNLLTIQDIQVSSQDRHVFLLQNDQDPILPGTYFNVIRSGRQLGPDFKDQLINVGLVKATSITGSYVLAEVINEGTTQSHYFFPDYPGIMVGDQVQPKSLVIERNVQLTPSKSLSYFDLFIDPRRDPNSFELSEDGKELLRDMASTYGSMRVPMMLIEGHTDPQGPANANQVESYQRALTVHQFLIEELGFDRNRLVAVGLGESEPLPEPYLPDHERKARRIVIKVKTAKAF